MTSSGVKALNASKRHQVKNIKRATECGHLYLYTLPNQIRDRTHRCTDNVLAQSRLEYLRGLLFTVFLMRICDAFDQVSITKWPFSSQQALRALQTPTYTAK